ncbi:hypothetical protein ACQP2T_24260 [Nonomuraea sp. CA-143628]|uniref:hypothetical protein n=1 Tax=Nonomuraea sp. CA-143628 TaxID=3239997 RepID=UPI003D91424C
MGRRFGAAVSDHRQPLTGAAPYDRPSLSDWQHFAYALRINGELRFASRRVALRINGELEEVVRRYREALAVAASHLRRQARRS